MIELSYCKHASKPNSKVGAGTRVTKVEEARLSSLELHLPISGYCWQARISETVYSNFPREKDVF